MLGIIGAIIVAFLSLFIPGLLFSLALFKGTDLSKFEVVTIGFIFGLIATPTLTWLESYVDSYVHAFSFSLTLFEANAVLLSIIGILLCIYEGVFSLNGLRGRRNKATTEAQPEPVSAGKEYAQMLDEQRAQIKNMGSAQEMINVHVREEQELLAKQQSEFSLVNLTDEEKAKVEELHKKAYEDLAKKHFEEERKYVHNEKEDKSDIAHEKSKVNIKQAAVTNWYWIALLVLMLVAFGTRIANIAVSPTYFEFDPYFDMIDAEYVITFGHQLLLDPSAWPVVIGGTNHRIQPLIPYMEAYWYDLANVMKFHYTTFSTSLMSYVSSFYPPITAALLVFVIFMLLYHEYGKHIAIIGASLTAMMPVLITTFIAGEQLLEPWGIFSLFFFFAAYLLAVKDPHNVRYAILAGVAFASTFLGAHYYTVDAGVLAIYILVQGVISVLRKEETRGFYKMNIIVIAIIAVFYLLYAPYSATLTGRIPSILHIPIIISLPLFALVLVALFEYIPKLAEKYRIAGIKASFSTYILWMVVLLIIIFALIFATPIGKPLRAYVNLSERFTTPATPLFMTVQEFEPTGMLFNFGSAGFGALGYTLSFTNAAGTTTSIPIAVLLIAGIATILILISVFYRNSKSGIFYLAIAFPLMFAGFSEVKYLPHFGVAEIMLLGIIMGELMFLAQNHYRLKTDDSRTDSILSTTFKEHKTMFHFVIILGLFFVFGRAILLVLLVYFLVYLYIYKKERGRYINYMLAITILLAIASLASAQFAIGESSPLLQVFAASYNYAAHGASACTAIANNGNSVGYDMFCNQVPAYWISAAAWMRSNVGPYAPRILAWWDYGDWINWFGNSNAVIRGDNAVDSEDYATAANLVLGPSYNYTPSALANFMNTNQTKYLLVDQGLIQKWQALDFLACIHINATSEAYAKAQGALQTPPVPYVLGTSQCEISHDPEFALVPLAALVPTNSSQNINYYCSISNATATYAKSYLVIGNSLSNQTACVNIKPNSKGVLNVYSGNGTKINAVIQSSDYEGIVNVQGIQFVEYLMVYVPGANGTVQNAPSLFYNSNFYRAYVLGNLPGFTQVYPANATGINFVNGTYPIRIFALDNFTGSLPQVPQKPSWVHNNYTMP
ncbi:MAG: hypothetical protein M1360_02275 [Candidatus Marsarchaeota archaeon]|jgi:asparagine N-glycosylation enzyme membrane subunit Stt3|nr:hypothetical protein [Candidatus Marsarchaeota archaeon]